MFIWGTARSATIMPSGRFGIRQCCLREQPWQHPVYPLPGMQSYLWAPMPRGAESNSEECVRNNVLTGPAFSIRSFQI